MRLIDADALIADCQLAQKQADRHGREFANAFYSGGGEVSTEWWCVEDMIENAPTIEPEPHWIPFKRRKPTEEEGTAFDYIMDCKCPEDGQNILVSINIQGHEPVQYDTFYGGDGEECCLESGYELVEEATAWMPLPESYSGE